MEKRYAGFYVSNRFIRDYPEETIKLMEGMIVLEATPSFTRDAIRYIAYHKWFPTIQPGEASPMLELDIRYLDDGSPVLAYFTQSGHSVYHSKGLV